MKSEKISIALILLFFVMIIVPRSYQFIRNDIHVMQGAIKLQEECKTQITNPEISESHRRACEDTLNENINEIFNVYDMYHDTTIEGFGKYSIVIWLFLLIPALIPISRFLKNECIKNECTRDSFKNIKKRLWKKYYKYSFVFPAVVIFSFLICFLYKRTIPTHAEYWNPETIKYPMLFFITYLLNIWIHCMLYLNIGLIVVRKYHHYFVSLMLSFLAILGLEVILEVGFGWIIVTLILHADYSVIFNIMNMMTFNDTCGFATCMIVPTIVMIFTSIMVYLCYRNKEKLIMDCEKND